MYKLYNRDQVKGSLVGRKFCTSRLFLLYLGQEWVLYINYVSEYKKTGRLSVIDVF